MLRRAAHAVFAAAIGLIVEVISGNQLATPLLQTAPAPVLLPEHDARHLAGRHAAGRVDLVQVFPARRSQGRRKEREPVVGRISGRPTQTGGKTTQTAGSPLGFPFETAHLGHPTVVVVVVVDKIEPQPPGMTYALGLAPLILLARIDVGVAEKEGGAHPVVEQALDNRRRTRRATAVQQHLPGIARHFEMNHRFHAAKVIISLLLKYSGILLTLYEKPQNSILTNLPKNI